MCKDFCEACILHDHHLSCATCERKNINTAADEWWIGCFNLKVGTPLFAATVAAAAPLQLYQVDPIHQPWGLKGTEIHSAVEQQHVHEVHCPMLHVCRIPWDLMMWWFVHEASAVHDHPSLCGRQHNYLTAAWWWWIGHSYLCIQCAKTPAINQVTTMLATS